MQKERNNDEKPNVHKVIENTHISNYFKYSEQMTNTDTINLIFKILIAKHSRYLFNAGNRWTSK